MLMKTGLQRRTFLGPLTLETQVTFFVSESGFSYIALAALTLSIETRLDSDKPPDCLSSAKVTDVWHRGHH